MKLHEQVKYYKELASYNDEVIQEIKRYLSSDKFVSDNTVNVNDILYRIRGAEVVRWQNFEHEV